MADERVKVVVEGDADDLRRALKAAAADIKVFAGEVDRTSARVKRADSDNKRATASYSDLRKEVGKLGHELANVGDIIAAIKPAALIAGAGMAGQALSSMAAGGVAAAGSLKDLVGLAPAVAQGYTAVGQAAGVAKLATTGLKGALDAATKALDSNHKAAFIAYRGGSTEAKAYRDELAKLAPEQRAFVDQLVRMQPLMKQLQASAAKGLLPGAGDGISKAAQNFDVIQKIVAETSKMLGRNASRAGDFLGSDSFGKDLATVGDRNVLVLDRMARSTLNLAGAAEDLLVEAGPLTDWLSLSALRLSQLVESEVAAARKSGELADFFQRTRDRTAQLADIAGHLASGLGEVVKAAQPLGDTLLKDIDQAAAHWAAWTHTVEGHNAIREWFTQAQPTIEAAGRLVHDLAIDFAKLGSGGEAANFLEELRTEVLPVLDQTVRGTMEALGPELVDALVQVTRLFADLAGSSGPMVLFVKGLATAAHDVDVLLNTIPGLKEAVVALAGAASIYQALKIGATISGLGRIQRMLKDMYAVSAGEAVVSGVGGAPVVAAAGARDARGARSIAEGRATYAIGRELGAGPVRAGAAAAPSLLRGGAAAVGGGALALLGGPAGVAAITAGVFMYLEQHKRTGQSNTDSAKIEGAKGAITESLPDPKKMHDIGEALDWLNKRFQGTSTDVAAADRGMKALGLTVASTPAQIKGATDAFADLQDRFQATQRLLKQGIELPADVTTEGAKQIANALERTRDSVSTSIRDARTSVRENMTLIRNSMDADSAAGKEALGANFEAAVASIKRGMDAGKIATKSGLAEIRKLMSQELQLYGFSPAEAKAELSGQRFDNGPQEGVATNATTAGATKSAPYSVTKRAGGGMASPYGGSSQDDHILVDPSGRPVAAMSGTEGIINSQQMPIVDASLAATAAMGLQPYSGLGALWASGMKHYAGGGQIGATVTGGGRVGQIVQAGLDQVTAAANTSLGGLGFSSTGSGGGSGGGGGPVPKGSVRTWIIAGLRLAGIQPTAANVAMEYGLAMKESGGNPSIANTTDINAQHGDPSIGLMQTTGSTFRSYMVPGHGNIRNPIDNMAASARYQIARYGHLIGFSPYAKGGLLRRFAGGGSLNRASGVGAAVTGTEHGTAKRSKRKRTSKHGPPRGLNLGPVTDLLNAVTGPNGELDLAELRADAVTENSLITLPDGSQVRDEAGIAQHLGELTGLISLRDKAAGLLAAELVAARRALYDMRVKIAAELKQITALRVRIKANTVRITSLKRQLTLEGRKKNGGSKTVKNRLNDQISSLSSENTRLNSQLSSLTGPLNADQGKLPDLQNLLKPSGIPFDIAANQIERGKLAAEYSDWAGTVAPAASVSSSGLGDNGLGALQLAQANAVLTSAAVQRGGFDVLAGFQPLLGMRLVGSFAHGTDRVRETGLALVHKDETITPDPRGPYGSQLAGRGGAAPVINVHVHGDQNGWVKQVRAEIDGRMARANYASSRNVRALGAAPGGR